MRIRFPSWEAKEQFVQELHNEHIAWQYGRKRTEINTVKQLPQALMDLIGDLKADYDHK